MAGAFEVDAFQNDAFQIETETSVGDSGLWVVTATDTLRNQATVGDSARGSTTISDSGDPG